MKTDSTQSITRPKNRSVWKWCPYKLGYLNNNLRSVFVYRGINSGSELNKVEKSPWVLPVKIDLKCILIIHVWLLKKLSCDALINIYTEAQQFKIN